MVNELKGKHSCPIDQNLPTNFDSRTQWPKYIHPIRDQGKCGSCWAFGAAEALTDRYTIESEGKIDVILSPQDMVSCDRTDYGCGGGYIQNAWAYLESTGIPPESCFPYTSGTTGKSGSCTDEPAACKTERYGCRKDTQFLCTTADEIKSEIHRRGPMETRFDVYSDFMNYKTGVYVHRGGQKEGGHAIKILGWGHDQETGLDYWLCANSWGTKWGEDGYFKIAHGQCGIDATVLACIPNKK